jgi:hypothetical protein
MRTRPEYPDPPRLFDGIALRNSAIAVRLRAAGKMKIVVALAIGVGTVGLASAVYAAPTKPHPAQQVQHSEHVSTSQDEVQAPPAPPRAKPLERVIPTSK